ncbi:MAG TPA: alcohol dehydrogenase catalytic domain-containing protein [Stenomitos sp.]
MLEALRERGHVNILLRFIAEGSGNRWKLQNEAIIQTEYGSTDVLSLKEVDKPVVPDNGVLVKVYAASVNAGDWHLMRGTPSLIHFMFGGILKPKIKILGFDVAGRVEAIGKDVKQFKPGDEVFGDLSECGFSAFAEYVCATEAALVLKPVVTTFEAAATVPTAIRHLEQK